MCLYPKLIPNKKYLPNKKNGGKPPPIEDPRTAWVPVGCQKCIECCKQKAREWQIRLSEDIKTNTNAQFVTLTFDNDHFKKYASKIDKHGYELDNAIATIATKHFRENHRKKTKKSPRHWLVTELGHTGTENIHLHGLIWNLTKNDINQAWTNGFIYYGKYVNLQTINYIVKYLYKTDSKHKYYKPILLTSPGIGNNYTKTSNSKKNEYNGKNTNELYQTKTGNKIALPIYYRNKIYSEQEREQLWLNKLDKEERWILGNKISIKHGEGQYFEALKYARLDNTKLGYQNDEPNWERYKYENQIREYLHKKRMEQ